MTNDTLIELEGISRSFDQGAKGFRMEVDHLVIGEGECVAVTGPSGSGKSTLLNVIGLLDRGHDGLHRFKGIDCSGLSEHDQAEMRATKIGFVFQASNLLGDQTAIQNVALPLIYQGYRRKQRLRKAR